MNREKLAEQIRVKKSFLCVGLDTDLDKVPDQVRQDEDALFTFNKNIIDATRDYCVSYKINTAFYECYGVKGWQAMQKTVDYIGKDHLVIADAKRGDIGNTGNMYAQAFFNKGQSGLDFDAVTVAPYMGEDSVKPFLNYAGKWVILLGLTSNAGSKDFQQLQLNNGHKLYEQVIVKAQEWGSAEQLMYVIGATNGQAIARARALAPEYFFLVPGVGAQGGSLQDVCEYGFNSQCGVLVNASRSIIYAGNGYAYADKAAEAAKSLASDMAGELQRRLDW